MSEIFCPKWKEGNGSTFMKNLERHLRYEVDLEKYESKKREIEVGKENETGGMLEGVGQLKATIPAREYFRWQQELPGCWGDRSFVDTMLRDNPSFKTKSFDKKTVQGGLKLA